MISVDQRHFHIDGLVVIIIRRAPDKTLSAEVLRPSLIGVD